MMFRNRVEAKNLSVKLRSRSKIYEEALDQNWCQTVKLANSCAEFKEKIIKLLSYSESICDCHVCRVYYIVKARLNLSSADRKQIKCTPHWAGAKAIESEKHEIEMMLYEEGIKLAQTKRAPLIVLAPKKAVSLCSAISTANNTCTRPYAWTKVPIYLARTQYQRLMQTVSTANLRLRTRFEAR